MSNKIYKATLKKCLIIIGVFSLFEIIMYIPIPLPYQIRYFFSLIFYFVLLPGLLFFSLHLIYKIDMQLNFKKFSSYFSTIFLTLLGSNIGLYFVASFISCSLFNDSACSEENLLMFFILAAKFLYDITFIIFEIITCKKHVKNYNESEDTQKLEDKHDYKIKTFQNAVSNRLKNNYKVLIPLISGIILILSGQLIMFFNSFPPFVGVKFQNPEAEELDYYIYGFDHKYKHFLYDIYVSEVKYTYNKKDNSITFYYDEPITLYIDYYDHGKIYFFDKKQ